MILRRRTVFMLTDRNDSRITGSNIILVESKRTANIFMWFIDYIVDKSVLYLKLLHFTLSISMDPKRNKCYNDHTSCDWNYLRSIC